MRNSEPYLNVWLPFTSVKEAWKVGVICLVRDWAPPTPGPMLIMPPVPVQGDVLMPVPEFGWHNPAIVGKRPPGFGTPTRPMLESLKSVVGEWSLSWYRRSPAPRCRSLVFDSV